MKLRIKVDNCYEDGHMSTQFHDIEATSLLDELEDELFQFTGDGHGADCDLGAIYEVTILEAERPEMIGMVFEYGG